jgi:hypothetical protein
MCPALIRCRFLDDALASSPEMIIRNGDEKGAVSGADVLRMVPLSLHGFARQNQPHRVAHEPRLQTDKSTGGEHRAPDGLALSELKVRSYTPPPTPPQPPTGSPRQSSRFAATPRHQHPHSPRRARPVGAEGSQLNPRRQRPRSPRRARPVGAEGSQLHPATNAPTAPDGLAPSELKVRSYTPPPTPPQPPTGSSRLVNQVHLPASEPCLLTGLAPSGSPAAVVPIQNFSSSRLPRTGTQPPPMPRFHPVAAEEDGQFCWPRWPPPGTFLQEFMLALWPNGLLCLAVRVVTVRSSLSVFWLRWHAAFGGEQAAIELRQTKRVGTRRGVVEIVSPKNDRQ